MLFLKFIPLSINNRISFQGLDQRKTKLKFRLIHEIDTQVYIQLDVSNIHGKMILVTLFFVQRQRYIFRIEYAKIVFRC